MDKTLTFFATLGMFCIQDVCSVFSAQCSCDPDVAFYARLNQTVQLGAFQTVVFNKVITNQENAYSATTGIFTAPVMGLYQFSVSVMANEGYTDMGFDIMKNGEIVGNLYGHHTDSVVIYLVLGGGDKVWVRKDFDPVTEQMRSNWSSFSGHLIRSYDE